MNGSFFNTQEFLERLTEITKANLTNPQFGVSELAREMGMSRSNLHLRVKKITKTSASQFINQVRLKKAMELLKKESLTVSEAAFESGFHSVTYFTKCFSDYYGYPPGEAGKHDETEAITGNFQKENPVNFKKWTIITVLVLAILIPVVAVTYTIFSNKISASKSVEPEKTIAVLPFKNDSRDTTNAYFINGLMESILNNLSNTPDLNVRSRTSVESYRNTTKSLPEIAKELGVNYIVEGSGQKYGDLVVLNIQLLEANTDRHLLSKQYRREVKEVKDFTGLQNEIALNLASEIKQTIKPEEVKWYKEISTENFEALSLYLQGMEVQRLIQGNANRNEITIKLFQARDKFKKALELDSTFTLPMVQLGWVYNSLSSNRPVGNEYDSLSYNARISFDKDYFDSALYYANRAIHFDKEYASAYTLLGHLYFSRGNNDKALENYEQALQYVKSEKMIPYRALGDLYFHKGEYPKSIEYHYKQLQMEHENKQNPEYWTLLHLYDKLGRLGFIEESNKYSNWLLKLNNDTTGHVHRLMFNHYIIGNYDSVIHLGQKRFEIDSASFSWTLPWAWFAKKNLPEATKWLHTFNRVLKLQGRQTEGDYGLSFIYFLNGETEKAIPLFNLAIQFFNNQIENNLSPETTIPHIHSASIYSSMNEKEKALESLRKNKSTNLFTLATLKSCPRFDNVRNEPEFQKIVKEMETSYLKHHEQIGKFLRKVGEIE